MNISRCDRWKNRPRQGLIQRLMACALLVLLGAALLAAQTEEKLFNYFYTHGFFADKNWPNTSDTINYDVPMELLSLDLQTGRFTGGRTDNIGAFATVGGQLYMMRVTAVPPTNAFDKWDIYAPAVVLSPVVAGNGLFTVIAPADNRLDTVFLVSADSTSAARLYADRIKTTGFTSIGRNVINLTPPNPNCRLAVIQGGPRHSGESAAGIWIGGSHGLLRFFSWNGAAWQESSFDLAASETITAIHPLFVATAAGRIFQRQAESFVEAGQPCTSPLRQITPQGAVGDQGVVVKKVGTDWKRFTIGSADYRFASFVPASAGSRVQLIDKDWKYTTALLQDSLTSFTVSPDSLADYVNHGTYEFTAWEPETLLVSLHDEDGNCHLPTLSLDNYVSVRNLIVNQAGDTLRDMHPDTTPGVGLPPYMELADTTFALILTPSSVTVSAPTRMRQFSTGRGYYWIDTTFSNQTAWSTNNTVSIDLAGSSLYIRNGSSATGLKDPRILAAVQAPISVRAISQGLSFRFTPGQLTGIRIFSPLGRLLAERSVSREAAFVAVPLQASSGMLCVEYLLADGTARRLTVPFAR
jgi:hypothetical protein